MSWLTKCERKEAIFLAWNRSSWSELKGFPFPVACPVSSKYIFLLVDFNRCCLFRSDVFPLLFDASSSSCYNKNKNRNKYRQSLVKTNNFQLINPSILFMVKLPHIISSPNKHGQLECRPTHYLDRRGRGSRVRIFVLPTYKCSEPIKISITLAT